MACFGLNSRVRIWRTGRHTPTKNSKEYPQGEGDLKLRGGKLLGNIFKGMYEAKLEIAGCGRVFQTRETFHWGHDLNLCKVVYISQFYHLPDS